MSAALAMRVASHAQHDANKNDAPAQPHAPEIMRFHYRTGSPWALAPSNLFTRCITDCCPADITRFVYDQ